MQLSGVMRNLTHPMLLAALVAAACAPAPEALRPTSVTARARGGEPAAAYDVRDDSRVLAHVIVWSQGAYADSGTTYIHFATEIQNLGDLPIRIDASAFEAQAFDDGGAPLPPTRLAGVSPPDAEAQPIAPRSARDVDFYFSVPGQVPPTAIGSLRVRWGLEQSDGRKYVQFTDFTEDAPRIAGYARTYVPIYGFYDPFWFIQPRVIVIHHVPVRRVVVAPRPHPRRH